MADIIWDGTNVIDLYVMGTGQSSDEKEGITLSANGDVMYATWYDSGDTTTSGIAFYAEQSGGFTFTAPTGKAFTKIEMKALGSNGWATENLGSEWAYDTGTVTWTGSAASTVDLLTDTDYFEGDYISYIAFYLSE